MTSVGFRGTTCSRSSFTGDSAAESVLANVTTQVNLFRRQEAAKRCREEEKKKGHVCVCAL